MALDTLLLLALPRVRRKKLSAGFDGGVMLPGLTERRLGLAKKVAVQIADAGGWARVAHPPPDIRRACVLAIACGLGDADDLDDLRSNPGIKLAWGAPTRHRGRPVLATNHLAMGERA